MENQNSDPLAVCTEGCAACSNRDHCDKQAPQEAIEAAELLGSRGMLAYSVLVFGVPMLGLILGSLIASRWGITWEVPGAIAGFALAAGCAIIIVRLKKERT